MAAVRPTAHAYGEHPRRRGCCRPRPTRALQEVGLGGPRLTPPLAFPGSLTPRDLSARPRSRLCGEGCSHRPPHPRDYPHPADIWGPFLHSRFPASLPFRQRKPLPHPAHSLLAPWELSLSLPQCVHDPRAPRTPWTRDSIADSKIRSHQHCDHA